MKFNPTEFLAMSDEELGQYLYVLCLDLKYLISLDHPICYAERADGVLTQKTGYLVDANLAHAMRDEYCDNAPAKEQEFYNQLLDMVLLNHPNYVLAHEDVTLIYIGTQLTPAEIIAAVLMAENETKGSE